MFHVKPKHQRLLLISLVLLGLGLTTFLMLTAFRETLVFYYSPSDLPHKKISRQQRLRIGGLVALDSLHQEGTLVQFDIKDNQETLHVSYQGLLPDLFREGQGVIIEGYLLKPTQFQAETVLAKHDENYMPKEVADQLKQEGLWRHAQ